MPLKLDPKSPYPSLTTSLRATPADLWSANRLVWNLSESPLCPDLADDEYARHNRCYDPGRRTIDEAWARFIEDDAELQAAIGCPPGFMRRNLTNEIRYTQMERGTVDIARGVLGCIHTLRASCYAWNGVVEARVAQLRQQSNDPGLRQWLRVVWADVASQESLSQNRNADLRGRLQRRNDALLDDLRGKSQSEQDLRDMEEVLLRAKQPSAIVAPQAGAASSRAIGATAASSRATGATAASSRATGATAASSRATGAQPGAPALATPRRRTGRGKPIGPPQP